MDQICIIKRNIRFYLYNLGKRKMLKAKYFINPQMLKKFAKNYGAYSFYCTAGNSKIDLRKQRLYLLKLAP